MRGYDTLLALADGQIGVIFWLIDLHHLKIRIPEVESDHPDGLLGRTVPRLAFGIVSLSGFDHKIQYRCTCGRNIKQIVRAVPKQIPLDRS